MLAELAESDGGISAETRHWLANEAFAHTATYDAAISRWFALRYESYPDHWVMAHEKFIELAYGENPHQKAALYVEGGGRPHVLSGLAKQHGKPLSFNNVLDLDSARRLLDEFSEPGLRDRQAQQPLRGRRSRRTIGRRLRGAARLRSGVGVRRRDRVQPAD